MAQYIGAIDQGTTSSRFIVFDKAGSIVSVGQKEHRQIYPKRAHVEHDPLEIWRNTQAVTQELRGQKAWKPKDFAAIAITNEGETTLIGDRRTGQPLHNALVWQDTRVDAIVD